MALTFTIELGKGDVTREQLDEVRRLVGATSDEEMPPGMLAHLESESENGFRIVDVWESAEDFQRFFDTALGDAFERTGFHPLSGPPPVESVVNLLIRQRVAS